MEDLYYVPNPQESPYRGDIKNEYPKIMDICIENYLSEVIGALNT